MTVSPGSRVMAYIDTRLVSSAVADILASPCEVSRTVCVCVLPAVAEVGTLTRILTPPPSPALNGPALSGALTAHPSPVMLIVIVSVLFPVFVTASV